MKALGPSLLLHGFKPPALPCPWVGDTVGMGGVERWDVGLAVTPPGFLMG